MEIKLPLENKNYVSVEAHPVDLGVPVLIRINVLAELCSVIDFSGNKFSTKDRSWRKTL